MYICIYVYMYICIYLYIYICIYVYMYICFLRLGVFIVPGMTRVTVTTDTVHSVPKTDVACMFHLRVPLNSSQCGVPSGPWIRQAGDLNAPGTPLRFTMHAQRLPHIANCFWLMGRVVSARGLHPWIPPYTSKENGSAGTELGSVRNPF